MTSNDFYKPMLRGRPSRSLHTLLVSTTRLLNDEAIRKTDIASSRFGFAVYITCSLLTAVLCNMFLHRAGMIKERGSSFSVNYRPI